MGRFNYLNVPDQWRNYWTKYPNGYTILESLMDWITQVDNMVDNINSWNVFLENFKVNFEFNLQLEVEATLKEWKESGFLEFILNEAVENKANKIADRLTEHGVNVWDFENLIPNKGTSQNSNNWDWTIPIKAALNKAYNEGICVVVFPHYGTGEYLTDPISFEGYSGITLKGLGASIDLNLPYYWGDEDKPTKHIRLKFKTGGNVGLQFADTTNPGPLWNAPTCKVENMWICGNNLVDTCINGNYGLTIQNTFISHAIQDGVTFEDFTYPALIENSQLGANGRHGLFVRGRMTTIYTLRRVNSSNNKGYGYCLEGGSGPNFDDCLAHVNSQGGLKINKRNDLYGDSIDNYMSDFTFNNFYSEANGTYSEDDYNYEGNYALVVKRTGVNNVTGNVQPSNIVFNGGALNQSPTGKVYNIESVYGLKFYNTSVNHERGVLNEGECFGLGDGERTTVASATAPFPFINKYYARDELTLTPFIIQKGGFLSSRGRVTRIAFVVNSISPGANIMMLLANSEKSEEWITHGYPVANGSIVGIKLYVTQSRKTNPLINGSLKLSITKNDFSTENNGLSYHLQDIMTIDLTKERYKEIWFEPLEHSLNNNFVGLRIEASADFVNSSSYPTIMAQLLIEE